MRHPTPGLVALLLATALTAQSNAVPGMDGRLYNVSGVAYFGRRGAAMPNGEAGFAIGHSFCNAGSVNIPWVATGPGGIMLDTYPKVAFLLVRESGGRMVQVSGKSFAEHSTSVFNGTGGPCGSCQNLGGPFW